MTNASSSSRGIADDPAPSSEADKFQVFERWLRINGAQFPLLELRKYDSPKSNDDDEVRRRRSPEADDEAEEKKDGGGNLRDGGATRGESLEGVAAMSLDGSAGGSRRNGSRGATTTTPRAAESDDDDDGSKEMRGVHARAPIPPQTVCVSIPKSCLITVEMGQSTPVGRKILGSDLELDAPKHIFLMIYLLWDRKVHGSKSFFAPYYDILPKSLRNMPIFWTDDELALLEGSHLLAQIADRAEAIREDYRSITSIAPEFAQIATLDEFRWARMIVCSRNFGLLINGHRTSALVPHADMLNHFRPRETKWTFDEETQCFTITTLQSIGRGAQVYDSYGQKCNHRFLLNYGFCVERNVEIDGFCPNEVPLELGLDLVESMGYGRGGSVGRRGAGDGGWRGVNDRECWERKAAFWSRGDAGAGSRRPFGEGTAAGGALGAGSGFHALAAAVAGASSSTDVVRNMASMSDASAVTALAEAMAGGTATSSSARSSLSSRAVAASCPVKRVRVCVSNNENTRVLFSMLRVLACDSAELDRIAPTAGRHGGVARDGTSPFYSSGCGPDAAARRLFGVSSPPSSSSAVPLRTCRDVRYPVSLRNERRAMELLLEVTARALSGYPTSLEGDDADLTDEAAYPRYGNARNAKLQVRGEKEVLHHFALWARTAVHVIDIALRELEAERRAAAAGSSSSSGSSSGSGGSGRAARRNEELGYDYVIRAMEDDDDCHTTILRYCSDVLGAVRRDELNRVASRAAGSGT